MLREVLIQAWDALRRNRMRSVLTMLGIVWGIMAVAVLMAYGNGFRAALVRGFDAFGRSAVVAWPGPDQRAGGRRARRAGPSGSRRRTSRRCSRRPRS